MRKIINKMNPYLLACLANSFLSLSFSSCLSASWASSVSLCAMIDWRFFQVSVRASMVNQVYGFGPTLKLLICLSSLARDSKSAWADDSDA